MLVLRKYYLHRYICRARMLFYTIIILISLVTYIHSSQYCVKAMRKNSWIRCLINNHRYSQIKLVRLIKLNKYSQSSYGIITSAKTSKLERAYFASTPSRRIHFNSNTSFILIQLGTFENFCTCILQVPPLRQSSFHWVGVVQWIRLFPRFTESSAKALDSNRRSDIIGAYRGGFTPQFVGWPKHGGEPASANLWLFLAD